MNDIFPPGENRPALQLHSISKRFAAVIALEDVSFAVKNGRIHALLGENGAGKTTLMRIAFGILHPDAGWISVAGNRVKIASPSNAIAAGIGMVHQQFSLIPAMNVAENVSLGQKGRYSFEKTSKQVHDIGTQTGLSLDPAALVADLGNADRQKLEIIRAFAHNARVMILDEPTAVLTARDKMELFTQLRTFTQAGGSVVLITHKLNDAFTHADEVTVLRRGRVVLSSLMSDQTEFTVTKAMLGESLTVAAQRVKTIDPVQAPVVIASLRNVVLPSTRLFAIPVMVNLEISSGEIIGIAALNDNAVPLLRTLAGRLLIREGEISLPSRIGFVPENRNDEALITDFSLTENFALPNSGKRHGLMDWTRIKEGAAEVIKRFDVRVTETSDTPEKLSGGNQQRFVLGREMRDEPPLLVLENPTQGLDTHAASFIHNRMKQACSRGAAVVFYSSDLDELAKLSDRILVVSGKGISTVRADRADIGEALLRIEDADAV